MDKKYAIQHLLIAHGEVGEDIAEIINQFLLSDDGAALLLEKLEEAQEILELRARHLTNNQQEALRIVNDSKIPVSADIVAERATRKSLRHKSHASKTLNELVKMGEIIKPPKNGQVVLYSSKP